MASPHAARGRHSARRLPAHPPAARAGSLRLSPAERRLPPADRGGDPEIVGRRRRCPGRATGRRNEALRAAGAEVATADSLDAALSQLQDWLLLRGRQ